MKKLLILAFFTSLVFGGDFEDAFEHANQGNTAKAIELFSKACEASDMRG